MLAFLNFLTIIGVIFAVLHYQKFIVYFLKRHPIFFGHKKLDPHLISEYKTLLIFFRRKLPKKFWPFIYFSNVCDVPHKYVEKFIYAFVFSLMSMMYFMPFVSAFVISILCAACFVFLVMQQQYTSNRLAFEKEIPFVIKLLSDAVNSGLSLYQAFDIILNDIQGPAHKIFQTILYKKKLGMSFSKIIKFEEENIQIKEFSLFCSAININEETGGSLRKVMNRLEYILSSRKKLKQKMAIAISESKSNGYMVIGIYSALMAYMAYSQPIFLPFFFFDEFGQKLGLVVLGLATLNISAIQYTVYMIKHQK